MKNKNDEFDVLIPNLDGTAVAERVKVTVPMRWDDELQEWLLTPEAHEIIENTKARHTGLLLPAQLKELRKRYDYTQQQMGELFQVGEKSWTRWECGKHRPSRSINLLIRALYEGEISINYLLKRAGKPPIKEMEWMQASSYWQMIAHCQIRDLDIPVPNLTKQVFVAFSSGRGKSSLHGRLAQLLHQQPGPAERTMWRMISTRPKTVRAVTSPVLESSSPRFKFPSEA